MVSTTAFPATKMRGSLDPENVELLFLPGATGRM